MDHPAVQPEHVRDLIDEISTITRTGTGRGPVSVRLIRDADVLIALLDGGLTKGEQSLIDGGRSEAVLEIRREFQELMRPKYIAAVQRITGRVVKAFMSSNSTNLAHAAEIFVLGDRIDDATTG